MLPPSALLLVFIDNGDQVTEDELHDWYSGEHIPLRVERLPTFLSASRYRAIDGAKPKWSSMYAISDMATFTDPAYTRLREERSERESDLMKRLAVVDRRIYVLISDTTQLPASRRPSSIAAGIVVHNSFSPEDGKDEAFNTWYEKEYIPAIREVPGWSRTRRFKLDDHVVSGLEAEKYTKPPNYLEITEFETLSSLHDPKFPADTFGADVISSAVQTERRVLKLFESFEPIAALKSMRTPSGTPGGGTPGMSVPGTPRAI